MELKYRWMQRKDFNFIRNNFSSTKDFDHIFKNKKIIANVVEQDGNIVGWIAYRLFKDKIKIVKFAFKTEQIFDFILSKLVLKSINNIDINISEYDLKMHLLLKNSEFKAISSIKVNDVYFYKFSKQIKIMA
jgi:hypothetical protein